MPWGRWSKRASLRLKQLGPLARRRHWFLDNLTVSKIFNATLAAWQYVRKDDVMRAWPVVLKVDISPMCNLHCTVCVHAVPSEHAAPELGDQTFRSTDRMSTDDFRALVTPAAGRSAAVSLYYLGDPLTHPHLAEICSIAASLGLNTHVSTNFSFNLSDARLEELISSGLTHLTVCLDGMDQESYERTRVGGRLDVVLNNLERLMAVRSRSGSRFPRVEVQFVKFQHNIDQLAAAEQLCQRLGVESFTHFWGALHNYTDRSPQDDAPLRPRTAGRLPSCNWPHFAMVVKFNGEVIPCCVHRIGAQYAATGRPRAVGDAFEAGLWNVWNSEAYRSIRRLVNDPVRWSNETGGESFCAGCARVDTEGLPVRYVSGQVFEWDDFYRRAEGGRIVPSAPVQDVLIELKARRSSAAPP